MNSNFKILHEENQMGNALGISSERQKTLDDFLQKIINPDVDCDKDCDNCQRHIVSQNIEGIWEMAENENEITYLLFLFGAFLGELKAKEEMDDPTEILKRMLSGKGKTSGGIIIAKRPSVSGIPFGGIIKPEGQA